SKGGPPLEAALKIDPAARPKAMDRTYTGGPAKGLVSRAIYELAGDSLRIGSSFEREEVRPRDFAAKGTYVLTYRRVTRQAGQRPRDNPIPSSRDLRGRWTGEKG